jgi:hypothetical protein
VAETKNIELTAEEQIKKLQADLEASKRVNKELVDQNKDIQEKLEDASLQANAKDGLPVLTHNKKAYQVTCHQFQRPGSDQVVTAKELAADKDLIAKLVKMESGVLAEVAQ